MHKLKNIRWLPVLMTITILVIAGFQIYWLKKTFDRESRTLEMRSNFLFRETVLSLQAQKMKLDEVDTAMVFINRPGEEGKMRVRMAPTRKVVQMVNTLREKITDSTVDKTIMFERRVNEKGQPVPFTKKENRLMQFLYDMDSIQDSIRLPELTKAYQARLDLQNISIPFTINRLEKGRDEKAYNEVTLGFSNPITFQLDTGDTLWYILKRISPAILFSIFLIGVTVLSFSLLYRNLLRQRRLADIKNEFISNITHELKTPIATVSVAIEALKGFNANLSAERTREYLNISANELQRLSLLVDKVLKLSMFEKKEIDLKYEKLDMKELVAEVTESMQLQFEKNKAEVSVSTEGDTVLEGDRLHLVSVIFNLLDNALKYSNGHKEIDISTTGADGSVVLTVADKGIGIPAEYRDRIFEKFFRVPTGNLHNAKGYGLGLSYVSHVIEKHKGNIKVDSIEGEGSKFTLTLPKEQHG